MAGTKKSGNRNNHPWGELLKSPRVNKVLTPQEVLAKISWAIEVAEEGVCECIAEKDHDGARRWHNALIQAAFAHSKAYVVAQLEADVKQLMQAQTAPHVNSGVIRVIQTPEYLQERVKAIHAQLEK